MGCVTTESTTVTDPPRSSQPPGLVGAVAGGALAGFVAFVLVATVRSVLGHAFPSFDDSAWLAVLALALLGAAVLAGWVTCRRAPRDLPWWAGGAAAVSAIVAWVPVRIVVWVARGEHRGLVGGGDPVLRVGPLVANLLLAAAAGVVGAWLAGRTRTTTAT